VIDIIDEIPKPQPNVQVNCKNNYLSAVLLVAFKLYSRANSPYTCALIILSNWDVCGYFLDVL
jgi:hypothetical protein